MNLNIMTTNQDIHINVFDDNAKVYENQTYTIGKENHFDFLNIQYGSLFNEGCNLYFSNPLAKEVVSKINNMYPNTKVSMVDPNFQKHDHTSKQFKFKPKFFKSIRENTKKGTNLVIENISIPKKKKVGVSIMLFKDGKVIFSSNKIKNGNKDIDIDFLNETLDKEVEKGNINYDEINNAIMYSNTQDYSKKVFKTFFDSKFKPSKSFYFQKVNKEIHNYYKSFKMEIAADAFVNRLEREVSSKNSNIVFVDGGKADNGVSSSSFVFLHNGKAFANSFAYKGIDRYEEISFLTALLKILKSPVLNTKPTHFVCDGDMIETVFKAISKDDETDVNSYEIAKSPLFKEVRQLYKEHDQKVFLHYVKSHEMKNNILHIGNDIVDKINSKSLNITKSGNHYIKKIKFDELSIENMFQTIKAKDQTDILAQRSSKIKNIKFDYWKTEHNKGLQENSDTFIIIVGNQDKNKSHVAFYNKKTNTFVNIDNVKSSFPKLLKNAFIDQNVEIIGTATDLKFFFSNLDQIGADTMDSATSININNCNLRDSSAMLKGFNKLKISEKKERYNQARGLFEKTLYSNNIRDIDNQVLITLKTKNTAKNVVLKKEKHQENKTDIESVDVKKGVISKATLDFENTFGNDNLFPLGQNLDNDKQYLIMRYGNKNVEIHRFENGEKTLDVYPQDFNNIRHLENNISNKPLNTDKPLVLSMPNKQAQTEIAQAFRGQEFKDCKNVFNIVRQFDKNNMFLTKNSDYSSCLINKDIKWFDGVLEESKNIKPERKSRKSNKL